MGRPFRVLDALEAQFELICADSISVFINAEVSLAQELDCGRRLRRRLHLESQYIVVPVSFIGVRDASHTSFCAKPAEVLKSTDKACLENLFNTLRQRREFEPVIVQVQSAPDDDSGIRYLRPYFGSRVQLPIAQVLARKKARIVQHWGSKLGIVVKMQKLGI